MQVGEIEGGEHVQLAVLLGEVLRLAFAQELKRAAESAPRTERAFRDGALHPVLAGREAHDLGRLAVRSAESTMAGVMTSGIAQRYRLRAAAHSGGICVTAEPEGHSPSAIVPVWLSVASSTCAVPTCPPEHGPDSIP